MKHAEMISKSQSFALDLSATREKLNEQLINLKVDYENLEYKGMQQRESLLFQMGQIEEQLKSRNKDYGALSEKNALTVKALEVAEEKIAHLEMVDKRRDETLKNLQILCADHDKALRQEFSQREAELETMVKNAIREANAAKLEAVKAQEDLQLSKAHHNDLNERLEGMVREKEVMIETHDRIIDQLTKRHQNIEEDLRMRRNEAKEDHRSNMEEIEQRHINNMKEVSEEKSRIRQTVDELKEKLKEMQRDHQSEKNNLVSKHTEELKGIKMESLQAKEMSQIKIQSLVNEVSQTESELGEVRKAKDAIELEFERCQLTQKSFERKLELYEKEKEHVRELLKVDFEEELNESQKYKESLEALRNQNESLQTEFNNAKQAYEAEIQELKTKLESAENARKEQAQLLEKFRYSIFFIDYF